VILPAVVAYVFGLFLGPYLAFFPYSFLSGLLLVTVFLAWFEYRRVLTPSTGVLIFALLVVGIGQNYWTSLAQDQSEIKPAINGELISITGTIVAPVRYTLDGIVCIVEAQSWTFQGNRFQGKGRIRVSWREPGEPPAYGNQVQFMGKLREPYGTHNPGGFDYGRYLKRQGIHAVTTLRGAGAMQILHAPVSGMRSLVWERVDHWRKAIHDAAVASLTNPALGLFLGMVLGEQSFIEPDVRDAFMASGTVHILSISGSHLGLLSVLIFAVVRGGMRLLPASWVERLALRFTATRCALLVTLPVVSFYAALAGAEMATVRSWIMILVFGIGVWFGRTKNIATGLAVAAFLMLIPHPEAVYDISFQLSYLSVAAMAIVIWSQLKDEESLLVKEVVPRLGGNPGVQGLWKNTKTAWKISLAVSVATLPLVAFYFHQIPWLGLVANLLVVSLVGVVIIPLGLSSGISALVMGADTIPFAGLNQRVFETLTFFVGSIAKIPGAEWYVASPTILAMLIFFLVMAGVYGRPASPIVRWGGIAILTGLVCYWAWSPRSGWVPGQVQVTFLDVGQGDATLIELPDGQTILIDGGPAYSRLDMGRAVIGPALWNKGIRRLDHVIATHPQWDHVGGFPWVLRTFDVGQYWSNGITREEVFYQRLQSVLQQRGIRASIAAEGQEVLRPGPCSMKVLNPPVISHSFMTASPSVSGGSFLNNQSVVTRLECGSHSFLLTADAEHEALELMAKHSNGVSAKVVKIPHHGAKSSLNLHWVDLLKAESFVVSVGNQNRYGHPAPEVVQAYRQKNSPIYQTDRDGAVWFTASYGDRGLTTQTAREKELVPVSFGTGVWMGEYMNWRRLLQR